MLTLLRHNVYYINRDLNKFVVDDDDFEERDLAVARLSTLWCMIGRMT